MGIKFNGIRKQSCVGWTTVAGGRRGGREYRVKGHFEGVNGPAGPVEVVKRLPVSSGALDFFGKGMVVLNMCCFKEVSLFFS